MALGYLAIFYMVLLVVTIILQGLLYLGKDSIRNSNGIFIVNMIFGIILTSIGFTSLPTNYTGQRVIAIILGAIAILAMVLKVRDRRFIIISKILLSISIIGGLVQLFI